MNVHTQTLGGAPAASFPALAAGPTRGITNLVLMGLAAVLAAIGATGWWVSDHEGEIRRSAGDLLQSPRLLRFRDRHRAALAFLLRRLRPEGATGLFLTAGLLALAGTAIAFGGILQDVIAHDELARFDSPILTYVASHRLAWLTTLTRSASLLSSTPALVLVVLVAGLILRWRSGRWQPLFILAASWVGGELLSAGVRAVVARPRPPAALMATVAHGYGFPSAGATRSAVYGTLAYLVARALPSWQAKVRIWTAAALVAFLIGAAPLYLGAAWPTDVLAGWALAAGWLAIVVTTVSTIRRFNAPSPSPRSAPFQRPRPEPVPVAPAARPPTDPGGLRAAQVGERLVRGEVNRTRERSSRSLGQILRANILTRFNALLGSLAVVILLTGSGKDALFGLVLVANTAIGIVQELRAKAALDRLVVLAAPSARAMRDGQLRQLPVDALVLDDVIELRSGDQVPVDGLVLESAACEVDESLLTGEAEPVTKTAGDEVLSGSFVVAGSCRVQATRVGEAAYARRLAAEGRRFSPRPSPLRAAIDRLLGYISWALVPTAVILFAGQFRARISLVDAVRGSVAGVVGMVPEGLVLLASTAMAVSVLRLARRRVIVQELQSVESLARVDVVCCDKTGTITDGTIALERVIPANSSPSNATPDAEVVAAALGALAAATAKNATLLAIAAAYPPPPGEGWKPVAAVAFSSARKWSGATFAGSGTWVLGAPEVVLADLPANEPVRTPADRLAAEGKRVVALARSSAPLTDAALPPGLRPSALVVLSERIRPEATATFRYFADQQVAIKVISGDNPSTVWAVAAGAGLNPAGAPQDARALPADVDALAEVLEHNSVFGRVTPRQKREMVVALRRRGHMVAMTGDGVNDVLALKEADVGIAMGSGTAAARAVAKAVLIDNDFAALPAVVAEGRRVIANVERTGSLFVTKTVYVFALALAVGVAGVAFPFLPRHLTLAGSLTIGIPGFFLALEPNTTRARPGFLSRVLRFAVPAGAIAAAATLAAYALARQLEPAHLDVARTAATVALTAGGLSILALLAPPRANWHWLLLTVLAGSLLGSLALPALRAFFALRLPSARVGVALVGVIAIAHVFLRISSRAALGAQKAAAAGGESNGGRRIAS